MLAPREDVFDVVIVGGGAAGLAVQSRRAAGSAVASLGKNRELWRLHGLVHRLGHRDHDAASAAQGHCGLSARSLVRHGVLHFYTLKTQSGYELPPSELKDNLARETLCAPVSVYFTF
jgi:cation diffusion facilitator CzcD-associated flavoprotein CzcO